MPALSVPGENGPARRGKDLHVETLRGLAILLMVAGHVIGNDSTHGMRVDDSSVWRSAWVSLEFLRLPLFTFLSGVVSAR